MKEIQVTMTAPGRRRSAVFFSSWLLLWIIAVAAGAAAAVPTPAVADTSAEHRRAQAELDHWFVTLLKTHGGAGGQYKELSLSTAAPAPGPRPDNPDTPAPSVTAQLAKPTVSPSPATANNNNGPCVTVGGTYGNLDNNDGPQITVEFAYELETNPGYDGNPVDDVLPPLEQAFNDYLLEVLFAECRNNNGRRLLRSGGSSHRRLVTTGLSARPDDYRTPNAICATWENVFDSCIVVTGAVTVFTSSNNNGDGSGGGGGRHRHHRALQQSDNVTALVQTRLSQGMATDQFLYAHAGIVKVRYLDGNGAAPPPVTGDEDDGDQPNGVIDSNSNNNDGGILVGVIVAAAGSALVVLGAIIYRRRHHQQQSDDTMGDGQTTTVLSEMPVMMVAPTTSLDDDAAAVVMASSPSSSPANKTAGPCDSSGDAEAELAHINNDSLVGRGGGGGGGDSDTSMYTDDASMGPSSLGGESVTPSSLFAQHGGGTTPVPGNGGKQHDPLHSVLGPLLVERDV